MSDAQYVTATELADMLKMTKPAIYQRLHRGQLPVKRLGRRVYFSVAEIEAVLNGKRV